MGMNSPLLFRLSGEVRNMIYQLVLCQTLPISFQLRQYDTTPPLKRPLPFKHFLALTTACKDIRAESMQIFLATYFRVKVEVGDGDNTCDEFSVGPKLLDWLTTAFNPAWRSWGPQLEVIIGNYPSEDLSGACELLGALKKITAKLGIKTQFSVKVQWTPGVFSDVSWYCEDARMTRLSTRLCAPNVGDMFAGVADVIQRKTKEIVKCSGEHHLMREELTFELESAGEELGRLVADLDCNPDWSWPPQPPPPPPREA